MVELLRKNRYIPIRLEILQKFSAFKNGASSAFCNERKYSANNKGVIWVVN